MLTSSIENGALAALRRVAMIEGMPMGKHDTIQEVLGRRVAIFIISGIRCRAWAVGTAPTIGSGKPNGNYRAQKLESLNRHRGRIDSVLSFIHRQNLSLPPAQLPFPDSRFPPFQLN